MSDYKRLIDPLARQVRALLMRGSVSRVNDSGDLQRIQVTRLEGEVLDDCDRVGQYGLTSVPPAGAAVVVVQIGGNADHPVVVGVDDKSRPHPLASGASCLYDSAGAKVWLKANGQVEIHAAGVLTISASSIAISASSVTMSGNLSVAGNVTIGGTLNGHTP